MAKESINLLLSLAQIGATVLAATLTGLLIYYKITDHDHETEQVAKAVQNKLKSHPRIKEINMHSFNEYELRVLDGLIVPENIGTSFDEIGGLDHIIQELQDSIFLPLKLNLFNNNLFTVPRGILLYGPPGTGKTSLAKAIARESGYFFLSINDSLIESKFYGESQKLINAVFTVSEKLQPAIIFIDEIDAITSSRDTMSSELSNSKKSMLLQLWDGLLESKIIIIGATNRAEVIDDAFLRRMPKKIKVELPTTSGREQILRILLKDNHSPDFDFELLAEKTNGLSGSDLRELKNEAANYALKNLLKFKTLSNEDVSNFKIHTSDMEAMLYRIKNKGFRPDNASILNSDVSND
ncbi:AAA ATPase domain-containing protein [Cavenderia fasciculata]|uniref:AAA ATPase domain-containing protein n=1 Tax=Cavenderia fasciculata TaxID=261658 RepID=F4PR99_CACFS|nr:AAA ATPase domain-containing protein [Cavenderia fasciculata]EGG21299.1 AAA ATPase domain-containing protein [Cavenderia fasciculata]|eukprot:XP_004359149.1 AAA ATPase domain-containing protein [Cavenderia fasciculata]